MTHTYAAVDIGMTNIDILVEDESGIKMQMIPNQHKHAAQQLQQALDLLAEKLEPGMTIGVSGGRYRALLNELDGFQIRKVDEMRALGLGGLALAGLDAGLVVSAGTGVAMVAASDDGIEHVTGSAVGGGTLLGLSNLILGINDVEEIDQMAMAGNADVVDIMLNEAVGGRVGRLPKHANAVNLGKLVDKNDFGDNDLAAGLVRLVAQVIAVIAINASDAAHLSTIIMVGHLMDLVSIRKEINLVGEFYNRSFVIPEDPGFGTVMGVLAVLKQS